MIYKKIFFSFVILLLLVGVIAITSDEMSMEKPECSPAQPTTTNFWVEPTPSNSETVDSSVETADANANLDEDFIYNDKIWNLYNDLYWYIDDNHAVIAGNIYDMSSMVNSVPEQIVIPSIIHDYPVEVIDSYAFQRFAPEKIILPDGLLSLKKNAFSECCIRAIEIPSSVTSVEDMAFDYCPFLEEIRVDSDNLFYQDISGCLYSKDGQDLICCPSQKTGDMEVAQGTIRVHTGSFLASHLSKIVFPESTVEIMRGASAGCYDLLSVTFEGKIISIGDLAFNSNSGNTQYYFKGDLPDIGQYAFSRGVTIYFNHQQENERFFIYTDEYEFREYISTLKEDRGTVSVNPK